MTKYVKPPQVAVWLQPRPASLKLHAFGDDEKVSLCRFYARTYLGKPIEPPLPSLVVRENLCTLCLERSL